MQNTITVKGKLNFQPKVSNSKSGSAYANFQIGVYDGKDASGKHKYFNLNVITFDERTVNGLMDLNLPANIVVTGRLADDSYTNKEGKNVRAIKIVADTVGVEL